MKKEDKAKTSQAQSMSDGTMAWMVGHGEPADWFVDGGASRHITGNRSIFSTLHEAKIASVILADGEKSYVRGVGEESFDVIDGNGEPSEVLLSDDLSVPRINLIFVSALIKKGFGVVFNSSGCEIRRPNGEIVAVAGCYDKMYRLCTIGKVMATATSSRRTLPIVCIYGIGGWGTAIRKYCDLFPRMA